jgi:hypothetical protein
MASAIDTAALADSLPVISTGGVLTPAQVQQQVSMVFATTDARTQAEIRRLTGDMAGRGFSANSPILMALTTGLQGQGLRAGIDGATQAVLQAAKLNADATYNTQKAVSDQFLAQEGVLNQVAQIAATQVVGILQAVSSMVGSIA